MTDKRIRMDCPFCHTDKRQIQVKEISKGLITILSCPGCGCLFQGKTKQEVINKWNCR